ncbi:Sec63-domain-containing protein [Tilletiaria anomala UBC 951]|uniref:Sec63-domain-containing protein n=1 Tax=Tilletiaria anomala (strain ATCC 24038 / CBS 436.72 / UBC 951) TaxID=1037660 RepID=A0A066W4M1_TILAU|nr:Sec63-domain-containing protein [Tilletiaria anomala UBC 951]KDN48882.1 Sec63-domain-containing protein [Tilletiaria anomala UBC 951]
MLCQIEVAWLEGLIASAPANVDDYMALTSQNNGSENQDDGFEGSSIPRSLWLDLLDAAVALEEFPVHEESSVSAADALSLHLTATYPEETTRETILSSVCGVLEKATASTSARESAAGELAELLGYEHVELVTRLLENPKEVVSSFSAQPSMNRSSYTPLAVPQQASSAKRAFPHKPYTPGSQVTIRSREEIQQAKASRNAVRREQHARARDFVSSHNADELSTEEMLRLREEDLQRAAKEPQPLFSGNGRSTDGPQYPHVFSSGISGSTLSVFGSKFSLPMGTTREEHTYYEEITIPPPKTVPMRINERLVPIPEMDPLCRGAFPGYKSLNRLQSVVYPLGYGSNENLLVCAPTGAGKTDVAMLAVLRCISQYAASSELSGSSGGGFRIAKDDFKIVYVAPMKALASEIVRKFSKRLSYLGVVVRELTGDMQLTRREIAETQMIVTTPEKWDVVTRRPAGEGEIAARLKLLIIDEVHLLHEDRGAVIETIVARTLRLVESSQNLIRIVGLSATLPNYVDVADFLRVNRYKGLFYFDSSFRPVPLEQHFVGVKGKAGSPTSRSNLDKVTFEKVSALLHEGHQVMVFVHARKETVKSAMSLKEMCSAEGLLDLLTDGRDEHPRFQFFKSELSTSRNREMRELFDSGFGIHHAGMLRSDRNLSERMFEAGITKVLCCTATLAWGVNLPAYAVVIKGTDVYDSSAGKFVDLSILDVLQIFGRAGRPQYEDLGVGYICTPLEKLSHYVDSITSQHPIESSFIKGLADSLNAEVALGTVASVVDGVSWLGYTYLHTRMRKQPLIYGMEHQEVSDDPHLGAKRQQLITSAAKQLAENKMVTFDATSGAIKITPLGRIAARYYIGWKTIETFNSKLRPSMSEADVLSVLSLASDFEQIIPRDNEEKELKKMLENAPCEVPGGIETAPGKVNILLQAYISKFYVEDFALVSETAYVAQNAARILRAMIEIALANKWAPTAHSLISMSKAVEKRLWPFDHPLSQGNLSADTLFNLTRWADDIEIAELAAMHAADLGKLIHLNERLGGFVKQAAKEFPQLKIQSSFRPIMYDVLEVQLQVTADFEWSDKAHGGSEPFYIWIEAPDSTHILQWALVHVRKGSFKTPLRFLLTMPPATFDSLTVRWMSDRWLGAEASHDVNLQSLQMPSVQAVHGKLLDLPLIAACDVASDSVLTEGLKQVMLGLTPIQTQSLHSFLHTSGNNLLCAPAGSGSSTLGHLAVVENLRKDPSARALVVGAQPGLLLADYRRFRNLFPSVREGDIAVVAKPDLLIRSQASIVFVTSRVLLEAALVDRSWMQNFRLCLADDLHLLDASYDLALSLSLRAMPLCRFLGCSASLQDSSTLASWLGAAEHSTFSFRPTDRPVSLTESIVSFDVPHSQGLMKAMIKPAYDAISACRGSAIIFVPSRAQCYHTAEDLATASASDLDAQPWLGIPSKELEAMSLGLHQVDLNQILVHGIGIYEEGMHQKDKRLVLSLFERRILKALIASKSASWTLEVKADLSVVMSTQYVVLQQSGNPFSKEYVPQRQIVDYSAETLVRMHSFAAHAAARDSNASSSALILTQTTQEDFYKKTLRSGLPLESPLFDEEDETLRTTILRIIITGYLESLQDVLDLLSWTFAFRRFNDNPSFYGATHDDAERPAPFISELCDSSLRSLSEQGLAKVAEAGGISVTPLGQALAPNPRAFTALQLVWRTVKLDKAHLVSLVAQHGTDWRARISAGDHAYLDDLRDKTEGAWLGIFSVTRRNAEKGIEGWTPQLAARLLLANYFAKGSGTAVMTLDHRLETQEAAVVLQLLQHV